MLNGKDETIQANYRRLEGEGEEEPTTVPVSLSRRDHDATDEPPEKQSNIFQAIMNVTNAALGAGILLFPNEYSKLGLIVGTGSLLVAAVLMICTLHIIGRAANCSEAKNYQQATLGIIGPWAGKGTSVTMTFYLLGTCTSYLCLIADQIETVFPYDWLTRDIIVLIAAACVFPIMLLPDITFLSYTSTFGVVSQFYLVGVVMYHSIDGVIKDGVEPHPIRLAAFDFNLGAAFALYTFSLQCHHVFIPVVCKLKNRTQTRTDIVGATGVMLWCAVSRSLGIMGYLRYGDKVKPDIIAYNLPNTVDVTIARVALALKCMVSYPLLHFAARMCFADLLGYDLSISWRLPEFPKKLYLLLTIIFLGISIVIAITVKEIDLLIDLNGAVLGVFQVYFWPAMLLWHFSPRPSNRTKVLVVCLVIICFAVTAFDIVKTVDPDVPALPNGK